MEAVQPVKMEGQKKELAIPITFKDVCLGANNIVFLYLFSLLLPNHPLQSN